MIESRKIQPGLWRFTTSGGGFVYMASWHGESMMTYSEDHAKEWLSQFVTPKNPKQS